MKITEKLKTTWCLDTLSERELQRIDADIFIVLRCLDTLSERELQQRWICNNYIGCCLHTHSVMELQLYSHYPKWDYKVYIHGSKGNYNTARQCFCT